MFGACSPFRRCNISPRNGWFSYQLGWHLPRVELRVRVGMRLPAVRLDHHRNMLLDVHWLLHDDRDMLLNVHRVRLRHLNVLLVHHLHRDLDWVRHWTVNVHRHMLLDVHRDLLLHLDRVRDVHLLGDGRHMRLLPAVGLVRVPAVRFVSVAQIPQAPLFLLLLAVRFGRSRCLSILLLDLGTRHQGNGHHKHYESLHFQLLVFASSKYHTRCTRRVNSLNWM
uniref:Uncharacterized protein n=1 Tax=Anopheles quadriannulatus TaxID=34691 RepID=A0A182XSS5_ANOQN